MRHVEWQCPIVAISKSTRLSGSHVSQLCPVQIGAFLAARYTATRNVAGYGIIYAVTVGDDVTVRHFRSEFFLGFGRFNERLLLVP